TVLCFFFQAEDGIRDRTVTGVQTCALPISAPARSSRAAHLDDSWDRRKALRAQLAKNVPALQERARQTHEIVRQLLAPGNQEKRSEERRVGKEGRSRAGT